ncbi:MAG: Fic family protein [Acinetobacter sp.]
MSPLKDPYCFDDADILKNCANIRTKNALQQAEADLTKHTLAIAYVQKFDQFDADALKELNRIIFADLYPWAGEYRTIQMSKPEVILAYDTVHYSLPGKIKKEVNDLAKQIHKLKLTTPEDFVFRLTRLTAALWQVHPFREGNTRTIVVFSVLLAQSFGIEVNYELFEKHASYTRNALVWGSQGIYSKFEYLENIYRDALGYKKDSANQEPVATDSDGYTMIDGYYVADLDASPHTYVENGQSEDEDKSAGVS